jgi:hypothetical protein
MGKKIKFSDFLKANAGDDSCVTVQDLKDLHIPIRAVPPNTGLFNTRVCRVPFTYNTPAGATVYENQGAYIVLGQVPPGGIARGYGAKGIPADSIDLVVGRGSSSYKGKGPKPNSAVDNNFGTDAARIYISRLCDIDNDFGLASRPGLAAKKGGLVGRSAIAVKADGVRIIGREGVKITTGKMQGGKFGLKGEPNSLGGKISAPAPKIELVAGNNYKHVQGVALGETTRDSLRELTSIVGEIWSAVFNMGITQAGLNGVLGVTPIPWHGPAVATAVQQQFSGVLASLYQTRTNLQFWNFNYLQASGKKYIVSRNVRTN